MSKSSLTMAKSGYPKYFGFFHDLGVLKYEPIIDINSNVVTKNNYEFLLQRSYEDDSGSNIIFIDTLLEPNLKRKNFRIGNWQMSAKLQSNSRWTPDRLMAEFVDPNNHRQKLWFPGSGMVSVISIIQKFEEIAKTHNSWLNYNLIEENEALKKEIELLKSSENYTDLGL